MKDPIITYRGASCPMSELSNERTGQLEQQQGTRQVQYRGQSMEANLNAQPQKKLRTVSYRGATAEVEV